MKKIVISGVGGASASKPRPAGLPNGAVRHAPCGGIGCDICGGVGWSMPVDGPGGVADASLLKRPVEREFWTFNGETRQVHHMGYRACGEVVFWDADEANFTSIDFLMRDGRRTEAYGVEA